MSNNEIKTANRKALPGFILLLIIFSVIGGCVGYFAAKYSLNTLSAQLKAIASQFGTYFAPWLMLGIALVLPLIFALLHRDVKKLLSTWDGEQEEVYDVMDRKLSLSLWISSAAMIVSYFLIAAVYAGGFSLFESTGNTFTFILAVSAFLIIMAEALLIQQKCIDDTKKLNPEKTVSVFDLKFRKKWLDNCDEAEKILIGKAAFKAYGATNTTCSVLAIVLAVCALIFETGFLPSFAVCLIWAINVSVYCKEALQYTKAGKKLS